MKNKEVSVDIPLKAEFYDVDSMRIVWHGNYAKFYEVARCALLDIIGYNYLEMEKSGYSWPVVKLNIKYISSIEFSQEFHIKATLKEYTNRLKIAYYIYDKNNGKKLNIGETVQMAIDIKSGSTQFVSPPIFIDLVENYINEME